MADFGQLSFSGALPTGTNANAYAQTSYNVNQALSSYITQQMAITPFVVTPPSVDTMVQGFISANIPTVPLGASAQMGLI